MSIAGVICCDVVGGLPQAIPIGSGFCDVVGGLPQTPRCEAATGSGYQAGIAGVPGTPGGSPCCCKAAGTGWPGSTAGGVAHWLNHGPGADHWD